MAEAKSTDTIGFKPTSVNVHGLTALIRNLGRDCTPDQFIREFVQNSVEACLRTGLDGREVSIDYNHGIRSHSGMFKLCFTDNGDGMTLEQMTNLLNSISASGGKTNQFENYGVGAKISSLTRNLFGVQYESWKDGVGHVIIIRYNPKFDVFGIQGFPDANGQVRYHRTLTQAQKPHMVDQHGTRVTLFGDSLEQDTMAPPHGIAGNKGEWLYAYLNRRYFVLPTDIAIKVRVGYDQDEANSALNYLRPLVGFGETLTASAQAHGTVTLKDAKAYWWVLKPDSAVKGQSSLLNQGELFATELERSNRLTHFGILLGRDRVVIIIEPEEAYQNISRTWLKKPDGSDFSWHAWQDEFRSNLPKEIEAYLAELLSQRNKSSSSKVIQKRLMSLKSLYELCGFKPLEVKAPAEIFKDNEPVDLNALATDKALDLIEPAETPKVLDPELPDETSQEDFFPRVEWTTEAQSGQLTGRAAEYIEYSNIILANQDFKAFTDLFKYFSQRYELSDDKLKAVKHAILEHAEQALMESVAGVLSLKSELNWKGSYHSALTKEALSAVVLQRFWSVKSIEAEIESILQVQLN